MLQNGDCPATGFSCLGFRADESRVPTSVTEQSRQCMYKRNNEACSLNHFCHRKAMSIIYSECVSVALFTRHSVHICHITLSSVACLSLPYFFTLSHKRHDFRQKKFTEHKMRVLIVPTTLSEKLSHFKKNLAG